MKHPRLILSVLSVLLATALHATIGVGVQMPLGNPSNAVADANNHTHYLISRAQYALDYNDTTREANWVAWNLTSTDVGGSGRSDDFFVDTSLPPGFYQVLTTDYSGSGYDRGHMCPSADRTISRADNDVTFFMTNMVPQTPDNNRGIWANFETYCRTLASAGNEVLITAGTSGFGGSTIASGVAIPGYTWKVVVVVPLGPGTTVDRIIAAGAANIRVIAIKVPNISGISSTPWENFVTSPAQIQVDTGYAFFTALPAAIASALRNVVDGSSPVGSPVITTHPSSQTTVVGGSATFAVVAEGDAPLSYQWLHDEIEIAGATGPTLTLNNVQAADIGSYYVVVTNPVGATTSSAASLVVMGLPPVVVAPPVSQTVTAGANVTFAVSATGSPVLTYQWRKNFAPIGGATASTLTLVNVQAGDAAGYDVVVTNSTSSATSAAATLTVNASAPVITTQPVSRTAVTAENAGFTVVVSGTAPLSYQWRKDGSPISDAGNVSGATSASLLIAGVTAVNGGSYDVVVANALGSVTSTAATLLVNPPPPSTVFWDFGAAATPTANPSSGLNADITGGTMTANNNLGTPPFITTTSPSTAALTGANNAGAAARVGALNQAAGGSAYFEFTLSPSAGKRLLATGLSFGSRSTGTGPQAYGVYTSLDGFTTAVASGTLANNSNWALITTAFSTVTGTTGAPITFRIYGYNGAGSPGASVANWRIDAVSLTLSAVFPPPVAPVVIATSPANGAANVVVSNPISITFNEAVSFTGSWFTINSASAGPLAASVSGGPTTFNLSTPSALPYNDTITVTVLGAQVVDAASGTIHGTSNTAFTFTTQAYVPPTPPAVTGQPSAQTVNVGSPAGFSVTASGTAPLSYQWRRNGTPIAGNSSASTASLAIASATLADAGSYDCVVSNVAGSDVSAAAVLTVNIVPPSITTQPAGQMVGVGGNTTLTVAATGTAPLSYQWRRNGTPLNDAGVFSGTHSATLVLTNVTHAESASYDVVVTNAAASVASNAAAVVVSSAAPSVITWDFATAAPTSGIPAGVTGGTVTPGNNNATTLALLTTTSASNNAGASGGNNAGLAARVGVLNRAANGSAYYEFTFTPAAGRQFAASALVFGARSTGTGPQAYTIYTSADGFVSPVATGTLLNDSVWRLITTPFAGVIGTAGTPVTFRIYGHNGAGGASANTANWRIDDLKLTAGLLALPPVPPTITLDPVAQTATVGDTVTLTAAATGTGPLSYQWRHDGVPIAGNASAATDTLILPVIVTADAGDYDVVVTNIAGSATSAAAALTVNKAAATVTLGDLNFVYTGAPHATTATTDPAGLTVVITYNGGGTVPVNAGSYTVVATVDDENYEGSATGTLVIAKALATVTLSDLEQTYTGSPLVATGQTSPAGLPVLFTYDGAENPPTAAGTYAVVGAVVDPNYTGSSDGILTIAKAVAAVSLGDLAQVYTGAPRVAAASTVPSGLALTVTYDGNPAAPTDAGSYAVVATISDANYVGTTAGTLVVDKAVAVVTLADLTPTYDGSPKAVSVTTNPAGLTVGLTYDGGATAPTNAGNYTVVATVNEANYAGTTSGTLTIAKAAATVTLSQLTRIYDGTPKPVDVATTPAGLAVTTTYNGLPAAPSLIGSYAVVATVNDANYSGTATGTLAINPADAAIVLGGLVQTYDGTPKPVSATTTPAGLSVTVTYDGSTTVPVLPGSYTVEALINAPGYTGSASGTLRITVTALVRHAPAFNGGLFGSVQQLLPESVTLNGSAIVTGNLLVPGTPNVQLNGRPVYGGTQDGSGTATPSNYTVTLNGNAVLGHVVRRTNAIALTSVPVPPAPAGTRNVSLNNPTQNPGDFATLRNLTLNGNGHNLAVPAGTYGTFTLSGNSVIRLGVPGGTEPVVYNFQSLTLNGTSWVETVGPVIINLASGISLNGDLGTEDHPAWLTLNITAGGLTLNGNASCAGVVIAPNGTVTINGNATLTGRVECDRLVINGNGLLEEIEP